LNNRASLYRQTHQFAEAERLFQIATRIWNEVGWPDISRMKSLDHRSPTPTLEMLWSEIPHRDRLRVCGDHMRRLRREVEDEERAGRPGPAKAELQVILEKLGPWFHNVPLTKQTGTRPETPDHPANRWRVIDQFVPEDLTGKTVLDIGCNAGFFSLEMKRRGAKRVVGIDIMPHILAQARFTSHWFDLPIELLEWDVYNIEALGTFDIVIFLGVLYHLKHPLYALEKVYNACNSMLYFQSAVRGPTGDFEPADDYPISEEKIFDRAEFPKLYFVEKSFNGDESNWWMATRSCLKAMLRVSGFKTIEDTLIPDVFFCQK
jgi:tRNA (mo5U34)-methyltransferase